MPIDLMTLLTLFNTAFLITVGIIYFKKNYVILDMDTYNSIAEICEQYNTMIEEGNKEEEREGGCGFFQEQLQDVDNDEENE